MQRIHAISLAVLLCLSLGLETRGVRGADDSTWPMWRYDSGRTAASPHGLPNQLRLQWVRQYPQREQVWDDPLNHDLMQYDRILEPIVAEGKLFVGFNDTDRVVAFDAHTGDEVWAYVTDGPVRFPPVYRRGLVYFASDDGYLYCVQAGDGELKWRIRGGPSERKVVGNHRLISMWPVRGGPVLHGDTLYFSAGIWPFMGTFIYALDADTGKVQWLNDGTAANYIKQPHSAPSFAGVAPQGAFAVGGDSLVVPGGRSVPAVFDRHSGKLSYFHLDAGGKGTGGALVMANNRHFYVHTRVRGVRRFDLDTGKKTDFQVNEPVLAGDVLYAATETHVTAMDADDKVLWQIEADGSGDLIQAGNRLYAAGKDKIVAIEPPRNGQAAKITWSVDVDGSVQRLLAGADTLIAVTLDGRILVYGPSTNGPGTDGPADPRQLAAETTLLQPSDTALQYAEKLLSRMDPGPGFALIYGADNLDLLAALVTKSELRLIVVEALPSKVAQARAHFAAAGMYGNRVTIHQETPLRFQAPPYFAKLVVIGPSAAKDYRRPNTLPMLLSSVRPYGGIAVVAKTSGLTAEATEKILEQTWDHIGDDTLGDQFQVTETGGLLLLTRPGALPGSAPWTHLYGNIANTVKSDDRRVKLPLGILWFGGTPNTDVLPRHGHGPPEQVVGGRLFIQGMSSVSARDVYTGQLLWKREFKDLGTFEVYFDKTYKDTPLDPAYNQVHIPGANVRGTNYVVTPDAVYLVIQDKCVVMDVATGKTIREIELPPMADDRPREWAYLGIYEDILLAGTGFGQFTERLDADEEEIVKKKGRAWTSDRFGSLGLVAMNRHTGEQMWAIEAQHSFLHNAIVAGGGRVFVLDKLPQTVEGRLKRRGLDLPKTYRLLALDAQTGAVVWEHGQYVPGTWLGYSEEHQTLLQAGAAATDRGQDEASEGMVAFRVDDGSVIWKDLDRKYAGPCILYHDKIITNSKSYATTSGVFSLLDGRPEMISNPLTGDEQPWTYERAYGCNTAIACENLLTFRSGAAGFYDLISRCGTGNFGGFRSGCSSNLIAADGVLNAPDYTRTCSCGYQNQTSLALVHMPDLEVWSVGGFGYLQPGDEIRRLGINLGAPGDRRSDTGTVWLDFPFVSGDPPPLAIEYDGRRAKPYRGHALQYQMGELPWVAASGIEGLSLLTIDLVAKSDKSAKGGSSGSGTPRTYTVRLVFAEPHTVAAGKRVFDVAIEGKTVLKDVDIVRAAESSQRGIVREIPGVSLHDSITISFTSHSGSELPPVLSGVELIAE